MTQEQVAAGSFWIYILTFVLQHTPNGFSN